MLGGGVRARRVRSCSGSIRTPSNGAPRSRSCVVALALAATFALGVRRLRYVVALWVVDRGGVPRADGGRRARPEGGPTDAWGGLPLSIFVFIATVLLGFPLAIALALGRGSRLPAFRIVCTGRDRDRARAADPDDPVLRRDRDSADAPGVAHAGQDVSRDPRDGVLLRLLPGRDHPRRPAGRAGRAGARRAEPRHDAAAGEGARRAAAGVALHRSGDDQPGGRRAEGHVDAAGGGPVRLHGVGQHGDHQGRVVALLSPSSTCSSRRCSSC